MRRRQLEEEIARAKDADLRARLQALFEKRERQRVQRKERIKDWAGWILAIILWLIVIGLIIGLVTVSV